MARPRPRPEQRPLRRLPQLEARRPELETCVFCPKLCRVACPVSNAEPRETLTPWGKMSNAYFVANASVPLDASFAAPAWACTGCFGCREKCDHKNDVTGTLFATRSALLGAGEAPAGAKRTLAHFAERSGREVHARFAADPRVAGVVDRRSRVGVLVGCEHARHGTEAGADAIKSVAAITDTHVDVLDVCCGAPLLYAGDETRFAEQGARFAERAAGHDSIVVSDAGCAATLRLHHAARGRAMPAPIVHLSELAAGRLDRLRGRVTFGDVDNANVRWHDPCQLGRGLGVYDAPRLVLSRALGRAPAEFERSREHGACSGAGGLLPVTMPVAARAIAADRVAEHERGGGGMIVTACASSSRAFARNGVAVVDLATVILRALA